MSDWRDSTQSERGPSCPTCKSQETSFCGVTDDGPVWLCSPCCEAFHHDELRTGDHPDSTEHTEHTNRPNRTGRRIFVAGLAVALLSVLVFVAITPDKPTGVPNAPLAPNPTPRPPAPAKQSAW